MSTGWGWDFLVDGVASTLKVVEAKIDEVVGIPPNTPLISSSAQQSTQTEGLEKRTESTPNLPNHPSAVAAPAPLPYSASTPHVRPSSGALIPDPVDESLLLQQMLSVDQPAQQESSPLSPQNNAPGKAQPDYSWLDLFPDENAIVTTAEPSLEPHPPLEPDSPPSQSPPLAPQTSESEEMIPQLSTTTTTTIEDAPRDETTTIEAPSPNENTNSFESPIEITPTLALDSRQPAIPTEEPTSEVPLTSTDSISVVEIPSTSSSSENLSNEVSESTIVSSSSSSSNLSSTTQPSSEIEVPIHINDSIVKEELSSTSDNNLNPSSLSSTSSSSLSTTTTTTIVSSSPLSTTTATTPPPPSSSSSSSSTPSSTSSSISSHQPSASKIQELERRVASLIRERDLWKKEAQDKQIHAQLEQANERVRRLTREGDELSKKQLQYETLVKKLRNKLREHQSSLDAAASLKLSHEQQLASLSHELSLQREHADRLAAEHLQLQAAASSAAAQLAEERVARANLESSCGALRGKLEAASVELRGLQASGSDQIAAAQQREESLRGELKAGYQKEAREQQAQHARDAAHLRQQIDQLHEQMALSARMAAAREDDLRQEGLLLQERLRQAHSEGVELRASVASCAQPFLQQIAALQQAVLQAQEALERQEGAARQEARQARERGAVLEEALRAREGERERAQAEAQEGRAACDAQRQRAEAAEARAEAVGQRAAEMERALREAEGKLGRAGGEYAELKTRSEAEKAALMERIGVLSEKLEHQQHFFQNQQQQFQQSQNQQDQQQQQQQQKMIFMGSNSESSLSSQFSPYGKLGEGGSEAPARSYSLSAVLSSGPSAAPASMPMSMSAMAFQQTLEQLRKKESELAVLRSERDALVLAQQKLEARTVALANDAERVEAMAQELGHLRKRHDAALTMIGQKNEQLEGLNSDFVDFKAMHNLQIVELLGQIESLHCKSSNK